MTVRKVLIAAALLAGTACGGNSTTSASSTTSTGANSNASIVLNASVLTSTAFSPNPIVVKVGDSVTWVNNDSTVHTSIANGGAWASGNINPGGSFKTTMTAAGTFPYHCNIHPGMIGTVTVQ
jgi:plastocyanin